MYVTAAFTSQVQSLSHENTAAPNLVLGINTNQQSPAQPKEYFDRGIHVEVATTIDRPADELFRFWRDFGNLPAFMRHLESVRVDGPTRSHWVARVHASRDHGKTWTTRSTVTIPGRNAFEPQVLQLADGRVLMAIRSDATGFYSYVFLSLSADNGVSWSAPWKSITPCRQTNEASPGRAPRPRPAPRAAGCTADPAARALYGRARR